MKLFKLLRRKKTLVWRRVKAGTRFPSEALVIYDGDSDARLSLCAIYDGRYLLVRDLNENVKIKTS